MTRYTVQCGYASYHLHTCEVEAGGIAAACEIAIAKADAADIWKSHDFVSPVFVDTIGEGDVTPWNGWRSALPVPLRFTEAGEPPLAYVIVEGGAIHDVVFSGSPCLLLVTDYDTESATSGAPGVDASGGPIRTLRFGPWSNEAAADPEIPGVGASPDAG